MATPFYVVSQAHEDSASLALQNEATLVKEEDASGFFYFKTAENTV